jgi:hypothetical protein
MDAGELVGLAAGVGFLAGLRLYATTLALGLAIRYQWLTLGPGQEPWNVLAHPAVLMAAGAACLVELLADKVAWLDTAWDGFHTFIRPVGAALLGAAAFATVEPQWRMVLILLCGGVAFTTHASKAAVRVVANHSPEPFSNVAISAVEDVLQAAGVWLLIQHPWVMLALVTAFLAAFVWLFRRIVRVVRRRLGWGRAAGPARGHAENAGTPG